MAINKERLILEHHNMVQAVTAESEAVQEWRLDTRQFYHDVGDWFFMLIVSFLPFVFVFFLFTGPVTNFDFLELFRDNAILYICVTISALALYKYGVKELLGSVHIILMLLSIVIYFSLMIGVSIPLFDIYDRREFIAWLFLFSILLGFCTLFLSFIKTSKNKGKLI